jgi:hypothetical protein
MLPIREVNVGRAPDSDILINQQFLYASNKHAVIFYNGSSLMFRDTSSNGTTINNIMIRNQTVPINQGDKILLAGKYILSWSEINRFFPYRQKTILETSTIAMLPHTYFDNTRSLPYIKEEDSEKAIKKEINKFNWGAFFLYPFWGFANGMWWLILIGLFFGSIPIIPNLIFGFNGSKWSWDNKEWDDLNHFVKAQDSWKKWGICIFCISLAVCIILYLFIFSMIIALST